jgi:HK97 family phage prohead protease
MENNMETKYASIGVKSAEGNDRVVEFVATQEMVDYDNEVVSVEGLDVSKIKKNKSFLWSHLQTQPPVGKIISMKKDGKQVIGKAQMTSEEEYPFGYTIYKLIKGGYINNVSISFIPDPASFEYKEKDGKQIRYINKATLLEVSAVNIGANPGTSIYAKSVKDAADKAWNDGVLDGSELKEVEEALQNQESNVKVVVDTKKVEELESKIAELNKYIKFIETELETLTEDKIEDMDIYAEMYNDIVGVGTSSPDNSTDSDNDIDELLNSLKEDE